MAEGEGYGEGLELDNAPSLQYDWQNESYGNRGTRRGTDCRYGGPTGPPDLPTGFRDGRPNDGRHEGGPISQPQMIEVHPRQSIEGVVHIDQCGSRARQGRGGDRIPGTLTEQRQRLKTYQNWPLEHTGPVSRDLADAGFYYTASGDEVECQYCSLVLGTWQPSDVPMVEHRKYNPSCPYIKQFSA